MIIMTFQHKNSLEQIKSTGRYYCMVDSLYKRESPKIYSYLQELVFDKTGINCRPIFGWSRLLDYGVSENGIRNVLDLSKPSKENLSSAINKVSLDYSNYYLFILDVPNDLVVTHEFYTFACLKCDEFEGVCSDEELKDFIYNESINNYTKIYTEDLQSCFPYIDKSFIKSVYDFNIESVNGIKIVDWSFKEIDWECKSSNFISPSSIFGKA